VRHGLRVRRRGDRDVCAGGTGGSEVIFRVIQRTNVVFDAGAEGTKRVQDVGFRILWICMKL
jgi:hypothetical protein